MTFKEPASLNSGFIGDQCGVGVYPFHSRFQRVINFSGPRFLVSLVSKEFDPGPNRIYLPSFSRVNCLESDRLIIDSQSIRIGSFSYERDNLVSFSSSLEHLDGVSGKLPAVNLIAMRDTILLGSQEGSLAFLLEAEPTKKKESVFVSETKKRVLTGVDRLFCENFLSGVKLLKGVGSGLTPAGDDFLCGFLLGFRVLEKLHGWDVHDIMENVFIEARGKNPFSNSGFFHAYNGWITGRFKSLVLALFSENQAAIGETTRHLLSYGHTSGADMATGFYLTMVRGESLWSRLGGSKKGSISTPSP